MRIISNFVDYYDCIQAMGFDKDLVYARHEEILEPESISKLLDMSFHGRHPPANLLNVTLGSALPKELDGLRCGLVLFCGRPYPFIGLYSRVINPKTQLKDWVSSYCWTAEAVHKEIEQRCEKTSFLTKKDGYERKERARTRWWYAHSPRDLTRKNVEDYFTKNLVLNDIAKKTMEVHPSPVIISREVGYPTGLVRIHIDGNLRSLSFYRMYDPYTAYQELSMWMGTHAWPGNAIPEVSDKDMIQAKGFDKFSFRRNTPRPATPPRKKRKK